jgi:hypothetical protein
MRVFKVIAADGGIVYRTTPTLRLSDSVLEEM